MADEEHLYTYCTVIKGVAIFLFMVSNLVTLAKAQVPCRKTAAWQGGPVVVGVARDWRGGILSGRVGEAGGF